MRRPVHLVTALVASLLLAGCAPGLAANPNYATDLGRDREVSTSTPPPPNGPPAIPAPKNDLSWRDCTSRVFAQAGATAPVGVQLECATYDADLDPIKGANGTVSIGAVRAKSVKTPQDAGPLIFTTGSDLPSSVQLPIWLQRAGADVLNTHPIVAVDRRGIGMSGALDCRDPFDRLEMLDQAQFEYGDDRVANLSAVAMSATTSCTDTISPGDSAYDNAHAAEDIERLRSTWDVDTVALMGVGNGAQVALAYAGSHPTKVSRLILDSPLPTAISAEAAAEQRIKGQQAALDAFAAQCAATNCVLGPDPKAAIDAVFNSARTAEEPGAPSLAAVADAISTALAFPRGDRVTATNDLAAVIAAARAGDENPLNNLLNQAETLRDTDGQFVNACSDALNRPTPDRVRELVVAWGKLYPQFGVVGALDLVKCLSWPSGTAPTEPKDLKVNVMLLGGQNDPIAGNEGVAAVAASVINAGVASKRVMWQGIGHGVSIFTPCAMPPLIGYLDSGNLPATDTYCPA